eukprot:197809-Amphidinium_carterae.4
MRKSNKYVLIQQNIHENDSHVCTKRTQTPARAHDIGGERLKELYARYHRRYVTRAHFWAPPKANTSTAALCPCSIYTLQSMTPATLAEAQLCARAARANLVAPSMWGADITGLSPSTLKTETEGRCYACGELCYPAILHHLCQHRAVSLLAQRDEQSQDVPLECGSSPLEVARAALRKLLWLDTCLKHRLGFLPWSRFQFGGDVLDFCALVSRHGYHKQ